MTDDRIEGTVNNGAGKFEAGIGRILGDSNTEISGKIREVSGKVQDAYGKAQDGARAAMDRIDPFVTEKPYAALGIAAGVGLLLGLMMRERKTVYIKK
jgi:uncharacterized protein YjbJ (UPF0337 family)